MTDDMSLPGMMHGTPVGSTGPGDIAICDSVAQLLSTLPGNTPCKAAVICIGDCSSRSPETMPPDKLLDPISRACMPIAVMIRGNCTGTDLFVAAACHFRFAATGSMIHFPDIARFERLGGLLRDMGIRSTTAIETLSGKSIGAAEAMRHGFIDSIAGESEILKLTCVFLQSLVRNKTPQCIRSAMRSIQNSFSMPIEEALREECRIFDERVRMSADEAAKTIPDA